MFGVFSENRQSMTDVIDLRDAVVEGSSEEFHVTFGSTNRRRPAKRIVDVIGSLILLVIALPLIIVLATVVKLTSRGPAIYRSPRLGLNGRPFEALKIRTMQHDSNMSVAAILASDAQAAGEWAASRKLSNDPRVTRLGRLLRRSSLDELPQLFNVLIGDMSLVGPRPKLPCERNLRRRTSGGSQCSPWLDWPLAGQRQEPNHLSATYRTRLDIRSRAIACQGSENSGDDSRTPREPW